MATLAFAGALGVVPTPLEKVLEAMGLEGPVDYVNDRLFRTVRHSAARLRGKVHGFAFDRLIAVDGTLPLSSRRIAVAHELGHAGGIPWQRAVLLGESRFDPSVGAHVEREADLYARELLFQGDLFATRTASTSIDLHAPFELAADWETTIRDTVTRYVGTRTEPVGFFAADVTLQTALERAFYPTRFGESPSFYKRFGPVSNWLPRSLSFDYNPARRHANDWLMRIAELGLGELSPPRGLDFATGYFEFKDCGPVRGSITRPRGARPHLWAASSCSLNQSVS